MGFRAAFEAFGTVLMEGALGERLRGEHGVRFDDQVAMAHLVYDGPARAALGMLWGGYIEVAARHGLPLLVTTPTRRANRERIAASRFGEGIIADNVRFLREVVDGATTPVYVGGLIGCRGDAYRADEVLPAGQSRRFHRWAAQRFADAGADFLFAGILPALPEAIGVAQAAADAGIPCIISFMLREDGRLIDGTAVHDAIVWIDDAAPTPPLCYMANCVHPDILYRALAQPFNRTEAVRRRFLGLQANASPLPPEALDGAADPPCNGPVELAESMLRLRELISLTVAGGCCGTDERYLAEIARRL